MKPKKRKVGRPAKITLALVEFIGELIALGMTEEQACAANRVSHKSFESAKRRKPEFAGAIKNAQADFLAAGLRDIRAGKAGWQGAAWILERRHKPQFNRTDNHALTTPAGEGFVLTDAEAADLEKMAKTMFTRDT